MGRKIRYGVVGLGHIAQVAVLPAFRNARINSELRALVSGDREKLAVLGKKYKVKNLYTYDQYIECLESGEIDAVYIATPNTLHKKYSVPASERGIHVLCEKPMATTERSCLEMINAAENSGSKLMIAYRLHFEKANLRCIDLIESKELGEVKLFNSLFSMQVRDLTNIRLRRQMGGGTLFDMGIYCINAARYLFKSEPLEVFAISSHSGDPRFREVDETVTGILRFPGDRVATFSSSFGAADISTYDIIGTQGRLRLENAYEYAEEMTLKVTVDDKTKTSGFPKRDQFGPELIYFSDCILNDKEPEPNGVEGLADVRIIQALIRSAQLKRVVHLRPFARAKRPSTESQIITRPGFTPPKEFHAQSPSKLKVQH